MKKIFDTILMLCMFALLIVLGGIMTYKKSGIGFCVEPQKLVFSMPNKTTTFTMYEVEKPDPIKKLVDGQYLAYNELTKNEKVVYLTILSKHLDLNDDIDINSNIGFGQMSTGIKNSDLYPQIKEGITNSINGIDFKNIFLALHRDFPNEFWWEYDMSWSVYEPEIVIKKNDISDTIIKIEFQEFFDKEDKEYFLQLSNNSLKEAKRIADECSGKSDLEKIEHFKKYILNNVSYDDYALEHIESRENKVILARSFINVFDNDSNTNVICGGYSNAFKLLCDLSGIECYIVNGTMKTSSESTSHTWNKVVVDGVTYLVDLTNSDDGTIGSRGGLYMVKIPDTNEYMLRITSGTKVLYQEEKF